MTPEKLFHELLGLGLNWEVIESRFERESGTVFLEIRETAKLWELLRCPEEGGLVFCYDHTEELTECLPAPMRDHLPAAARQMPPVRPRLPGAAAVGGVGHAFHQGV